MERSMGLSKAMQEVPRAEQRPSAAKLRIPEAIQVAIVFLPVLVTLVYIYLFTVDLPYMDQWMMVPPIVHMESGHMHWTDVYRQHNEALVPVSMAVTLLLAKLTHYNVAAEAYTASGCIFAGLGVLFAFFRRLQRTVPVPTLAFLPISAMFVGWRGHEGLLWGAALASNLQLMFVLLSLWAVLRATETPRMIWAALLFAVLAVYSFGTGMMIWPLGVAILLFPEQGPRRKGLLILWATIDVAVMSPYFIGLNPHVVPWPTGWRYVLAHPSIAAHYILIFTGSALGGTPVQDGLVNIGLSVLLVPAAWIAVRDRKLRWAVMPFAASAGFMLLTVPPLVMGRLGLGFDQPYFASRYSQIAALWPIMIYVTVLTVSSTRNGWWRYSIAAAIALLCYGLAGGYQEGLTFATADRIKKLTCRETLRNYRMLGDPDLNCFYPDFGVGRREAFWLENYHLSVFRDFAEQATASESPTAPGR
jgi:hypothetical protein